MFFVCDRQICVNLSAGLLVDGDTMDDIVLHLNPRFNENKVVVNTLTSNKWGIEEIKPNPLKIGQAVEIRILCLTEYYSVSQAREIYNRQWFFFYLSTFILLDCFKWSPFDRLWSQITIELC